jgi:diguanylate cyclase (GGDEF)-like protein/PAS domain S-box-containing protein
MTLKRPSVSARAGRSRTACPRNLRMSQLPSPAPETVGAEAQRQKIALLARGATVAAAVTLVNSLLVAFVNASAHASVAATAIWWGVMACVSAARWALARGFLRQRAWAADARRWQRHYIAATALVAGLWGAGAVLFMWNAADGPLLFTGLVLCGMVAGAVPLLGAAPSAFRAYALLAGLPASAIVLLQADSALRWSFGAAALIFLGAMLESARRLYLLLDASIRLGLEKGHLLDRLERDVSARKATEAALAASEKLYRTLFDDVPLGIAVTSFEGAVVTANETMFRMFGYAPEGRQQRLGNIDIRRLYADAAMRDEWLEIVRSGGTVRGYETQFRRRDGSRFFGSLTVDRVEQQGGAHLLVILEDVTQRRQLQERMYHQAHYDALTDLPNRRLMLERLAQAMDDAQRLQRGAAVLFLDLDRFKRVNDSLGHDVGDRLLKEVALRLKAVVRRGDTVCRLGGDEFVVVLADLEQPEDASMVARKILDVLQMPLPIGAQPLAATVSIGIAVHPDGCAGSAEELVRNADEAMYAAKQAGGNRWRWHAEDAAPDPSPSSSRRGFSGFPILRPTA